MLNCIRIILAWLMPGTGSRRDVPQQPAVQRETPTMRRPRFAPIYVDHLPLVRPYLIAHEQQQRRNALLAASVGIDIDTRNIHAGAVAA